LLEIERIVAVGGARSKSALRCGGKWAVGGWGVSWIFGCCVWYGNRMTASW